MTKRKRRNKYLYEVLDWAEVIVGSALAILLLFTFVFNRLRVKGNSMEDTLFDGDRIIIRSLFYEPAAGDIVVCRSELLGELIVKRVIALGGQTVTIDYAAGTVSVDGKVLDEPYLKYHALDDMGSYDMTYYDPEREVFEYNVPAGSVFLLGDNRDRSNDSRAFGCVSEDDIIGKAIFRFRSDRARIGKIV
ncbi:signal peptidase I [Ruminococcus sp.]|uniref:signal peptidase I n=1 Tax=Ruminococcus sp. TaxID=41978 RepID=UPI0025D6DE30|nr:signal peptidase I [Ruminococcus sp.]MBQ8967647.1 signal peptidase I [Ruminococcus sp.]